MQQAANILTVTLDSPPTGFFGEISGDFPAVVDAVHVRLDQIGALLFLVKNSDALPLHVQNAIGAIETMVDDAAALLTVTGAGLGVHTMDMNGRVAL